MMYRRRTRLSSRRRFLRVGGLAAISAFVPSQGCDRNDVVFRDTPTGPDMSATPTDQLPAPPITRIELIDEVYLGHWESLPSGRDVKWSDDAIATVNSRIDAPLSVWDDFKDTASGAIGFDFERLRGEVGDEYTIHGIATAGERYLQDPGSGHRFCRNPPAPHRVAPRAGGRVHHLSLLVRQVDDAPHGVLAHISGHRNPAEIGPWGQHPSRAVPPVPGIAIHSGGHHPHRPTC